jgi:hypothetical protein
MTPVKIKNTIRLVKATVCNEPEYRIYFNQELIARFAYKHHADTFLGYLQSLES